MNFVESTCAVDCLEIPVSDGANIKGEMFTWDMMGHPPWRCSLGHFPWLPLCKCYNLLTPIPDPNVNPRVIQKDRTRQDRTVKKVTFRVSSYLRRSPHCTDWNQNLHGGRSPYIITCAKLQDEIFRGYDFTGGESPIFLFFFAQALQYTNYTVQPTAILVIVSSRLSK